MSLLKKIARLTASRGPSSAGWGKREWISRAVAGIDDALIATNQLDRVMFLNANAESLTGWDLDEAFKRPLAEVLPVVGDPDEGGVDCWSPGAEPVKATPLVCQKVLKARNGKSIPVECRVAPIVGAGGEVIGTVVLVRDVTGKKQVREAMTQMAAIVETSDDAIVGVAMDGSVMTWNDGACRLYGYAAGEIVGKPFSLTFPPDHADELGEIREEIRLNGVVRHQDTVRLRQDGTRVEVSVSISPIKGDGGTVVGFSSIARDISERKRAEEELRRTELLRELSEAQERDRRRISHDLHDQMEQHLAALKFGLERMATAPLEGDHLSGLLELVRQLGRDVRRIALELRPSTLDDLGLHDALTNYFAEWSERSGVEVDFHGTGLEGKRLPPAIETALYRVVQEALTNVLKHSGAARVSVILERRGGHLLAIVEDDGRGFAYDEDRTRPVAGGRLGLLGMKERVTGVGGTLDVETAPGRGTSLFIRVPLPEGGGPS